MTDNKGKHFSISELEELIKLNDKDCKQKLTDYVKNYHKAVKEKKQEEQSFRSRFNKLGVSDKALNSEVYDSPNCDSLLFGKTRYCSKDRWYLEHETGIDISWGVKTLYDVLKEIEKVSKSKIISFGIDVFYNFEDYNGCLTSIKANRAVGLFESGDSFNLQLSNGEYYHLYFCESK